MILGYINNIAHDFIDIDRYPLGACHRIRARERQTEIFEDRLGHICNLTVTLLLDVLL